MVAPDRRDNFDCCEKEEEEGGMMFGVLVQWSDRKNSPGYVIDANGCHIWIGGRTKDGYGQVRVGHKMKLVHRVRYEREIGLIPNGFELDHYVCDNGPGGCCNPRHCRPVTQRENMLRGNSFAAWNRAKTHCPRGHLLEGDNLVKSEKRGRACRVCHNARVRRRWHAAEQLAEQTGRRRPQIHRKTHCLRGHPYNQENSRIYKGKRFCRACHRVRERARYMATRFRRK